jgi:bifunctional non-homologous end joining protein LigD
MSLAIYRKKRDFRKTTEPRGKVFTKAKKHLFVVQKHAASHLHYDFRLELNGVLISWAVPKGPSLDPAVKRLAMHVEDHPLAYANFEGIIPQGHYGGGTVMVWDQGEWISENDNDNQAYEKGNMTFILRGKKLKGSWKLVRMNKNDKTWLLIKINDKFAKPDSEITNEKPRSVLSRLSLDGIRKKFHKTNK